MGRKKHIVQFCRVSGATVPNIARIRTYMQNPQNPTDRNIPGDACNERLVIIAIVILPVVRIMTTGHDKRNAIQNRASVSTAMWRFACF